jgi:hypothetical protein
VVHRRKEDFLFNGIACLSGSDTGVLVPINFDPVLREASAMFKGGFYCSQYLQTFLRRGVPSARSPVAGISRKNEGVRRGDECTPCAN